MLMIIIDTAEKMSPNAKMIIPMMRPQIEKQLEETSDEVLRGILENIRAVVDKAEDYLDEENEEVLIN
jgi:hypothetical protein